MPVKNVTLKKPTLNAHKQLSYESLVTAWLLSDGWEVLLPAIDHGKKTDLVAADNSKYYRIQIKTMDTENESAKIVNKWKGAGIDYVICFALSGAWGYVMPAFSEMQRRLNHISHIRFDCQPKHFLKAFNKS